MLMYVLDEKRTPFLEPRLIELFDLDDRSYDMDDTHEKNVRHLNVT